MAYNYLNFEEATSEYFTAKFNDGLIHRVIKSLYGSEVKSIKETMFYIEIKKELVEYINLHYNKWCIRLTYEQVNQIANEIAFNYNFKERKK